MIVRELMTGSPLTLPPDASVAQAARVMLDRGTGDVIVTDGHGGLSGILTDRDIVTRVIAVERNPALTPLRDVLSANPVAVHPDDDADIASSLMRHHAVRRLPVTDDDGTVVGIVSLGDLAVGGDAGAILAAISAAAPSD
jgi:CBS domain-containing protein